MPIRMSDLLKESIKKMTKKKLRLTEEEGEAPVKRGRGRPPGAKNKPKPETPPPETGDAPQDTGKNAQFVSTNPEIIAAKERQKERDAAILAAAAEELKAREARQRTRGIKIKPKSRGGQSIDVAPLPNIEDELPTYTGGTSRRSAEYNPDDVEFDIDTQRGNRGQINLGERKIRKGDK